MEKSVESVLEELHEVVITESQKIIDEVNNIRTSDYDISQIKHAKDVLCEYNSIFFYLRLKFDNIKDIITSSIEYVDNVVSLNMPKINEGEYYKISSIYGDDYVLIIKNVSSDFVNDNDRRYYEAKVISDNDFTCNKHYIISPYSEITNISKDEFESRFKNLL